MKNPEEYHIQEWLRIKAQELRVLLLVVARLSALT